MGPSTFLYHFIIKILCFQMYQNSRLFFEMLLTNRLDNSREAIVRVFSLFKKERDFGIKTIEASSSFDIIEKFCTIVHPGQLYSIRWCLQTACACLMCYTTRWMLNPKGQIPMVVKTSSIFTRINAVQSKLLTSKHSNGFFFTKPHFCAHSQLQKNLDRKIP